MPPAWTILSAAWLGLVTAVMPCPLAANVAAVTYIARRVGRTRQAVLSSLLYAAGRSLAYVAIAVLLAATGLKIPQVAAFLQLYLNKVLGPVLILVGMVMLGLIRFRLPGVSVGESMQRRVDRGGPWAAGLLGLVLALSFCPPSAAVFFGTLVPMAVDHKAPLVLPVAYGLCTALPVAVFGVLIALGTTSLGSVLHKVQTFERWARAVTGLVFILVGIYYSLVYIFAVPLWG